MCTNQELSDRNCQTTRNLDNLGLERSRVDIMTKALKTSMLGYTQPKILPPFKIHPTAAVAYEPA